MAWKDTTFIYPDKSFAEVEVGDMKQSDFYPQVKIKRWENECNFSARLKTEHNNPEIVEEDGKIKWKDGDIEAHFYELAADGEQLEEGGLEFEIVYHKKPASNVVEFTIQTKGLDFHYQPHEAESTVIPENVKGSYAVYHKTKMHNKYKTGKAFHIYRPHVVDSDGNETWGDLHIDIDTGILEITVPQHFLDQAVYPVLVDPTLGYTSIGATALLEQTFGSALAWASEFTMPSDPGGGGTPGPIHTVSMHVPVASSSIGVATWLSSSGSIKADSAGFTPSIGWNHRSISGGSVPIYSTAYLIGFYMSATRSCYNSVDLTGGTSHDDTSYNGSTFNKDTTGTKKRSFYFTYNIVFNEDASDGLELGDTPVGTGTQTFGEAASDGMELGETLDVGQDYAVSSLDGMIFSEGGITTNRIRVQSGVVTHLTSGIANQYFNLTHTVDPDHTFIIAEVQGRDNTADAKRPNNWGIRCNIEPGGTQFRLVRSAKYTNIDVSYMVVECFNNEFTVQRDLLLHPDTSLTITDTISAVDTSKSMILVSNGARYTALTRQDEVFITAKFNSSTEIEFEKGRVTDNGEDCSMYWQVVEFADITVQTGEKDCSGDISSGVTATISSVNTARTWVHTQLRVTSCYANEGDAFVRTRLTDVDELTFDKYTSNDKASTVRYWVIEWPDGVTVERDDTAFTTETSKDVTVSVTEQDQTLIDVNLKLDDPSQDGAFTEGMWSSEYINATTVRHVRDATVGFPSGTLHTQTIDFNGWTITGTGVEAEVIFNPITADGVEFGDVVTAPGSIYNISAADGLDLGEAVIPENVIDSTITDGLELGDIIATIVSVQATSSDGVEFGDTIVGTSGAELFVTDGIIFSDLTFSFFGTMDYLTDGIELSDTPVPNNVIDRGLTEGIDFSDTPTIESIVNALLTDGIELSDTTTIIANMNPPATDGIDFSDTPDADAQIFRSASDGMILSDTIDAEALIEGTITDGLILGDPIEYDLIFNVDSSDGMTFGEQLDVLFTAVANAADGVDFGDEALPFRVFAEFVTDGVILADVIDVEVDFVTSLTEGLVFSEVVIGDLAGRLVMIEARDIEYLFYAEDIDYRQQANPVPYTFIARVPPTTLGEP